MPYPPHLSVAEQDSEADTSPPMAGGFTDVPVTTSDAWQGRGTVHIGGAQVNVHDAAAIRLAAAHSIDEAFLSRSSPGIAPSPDRTPNPGALPGTATSGSYAVLSPAPEEQRRAVGLAGEEIAAIWLRREFPGSRVRWVSGYAAREGHTDASDSHGYDFLVEWRGRTYFVEVKAFAETQDVVDVNLGESEVRAARAHTDDDSYKILIVNGALEPEHDGYAVLMPNPLTPQGARQSELMGQGLRFRYRFRANQSGQ